MKGKHVRLRVILNNYCLTSFMGLFETLCYSFCQKDRVGGCPASRHTEASSGGSSLSLKSKKKTMKHGALDKPS